MGTGDKEVGVNKVPRYCPEPHAFVNGYACLNTEYISHKQLKCTLPQGVGVALRVTVILGNQDSLPNGFFSYAKPVMHNVVPKHGPAVGGTVVTVSGEHFGPTATAGDCTSAATSSCLTGTCCASFPKTNVKINDIVCTPTVWKSNTEILCTVNVHPGVGSRNPWTVVVGGQTTTVLNEEVRYTIDPPTVASVVPQIVPRGGGTMALISKGRSGNVWENVAAVVVIDGVNFGTTSSEVQAGFDDMPCSNVKWLSNNKISCTLTLPVRDGFEDRTPWVVVGGQESYASSRPITEVEYRTTGYKEYPACAIPMPSTDATNAHVFVSVGLNLQQCLNKCDLVENCKGITRPFAKSNNQNSKCTGWSIVSIRTCEKDTHIPPATTVFLHESIQTTEIGSCHSRDTLRFGPMVTGVSQTANLNTNGGEVIVVNGYNFGLPHTPKSKTTVAFVDGFPCLSTVVETDTKLECTVPPNGVSGGSVLLTESFETYINGVVAPAAADASDHLIPFALNPLYFDNRGSTGGVSSTCGSISTPGAAWVWPMTGSKVLMLQPLSMRFGGQITFALKIGRGKECTTFTDTSQSVLTGLAVR